jgi:hypothetical protein
MGKPEGKKPLGRPRKGGIILKWILGIDLIDPAQHRVLVYTIMNLQVP